MAPLNKLWLQIVVFSAAAYISALQFTYSVSQKGAVLMFLFLFYNGTPYLCINQRGALLVLLLCRGKPFFHTASHIFTQSISSEFIVGKKLRWIYLSLYLSYKHEDVADEQLNKRQTTRKHTWKYHFFWKYHHCKPCQSMCYKSRPGFLLFLLFLSQCQSAGPWDKKEHLWCFCKTLDILPLVSVAVPA